MDVVDLEPARADVVGVHQHHERRWVILAFLGLAQLMVVLDATIVNIALPSAQASLGFSNVDRQWLVTAYSLAFGSVLFLGGRLSDLLGRKTALQVGLIGFAVASAIGGASVNFPMLVVARAVQGTMGGILAPAALAMLTTTFTDPKERGKAFGIYGSIAGAGAAIGLLLGGVLTQYLDWRWTLYVNLIIAGFAIVGTQVLLVRERGQARGGLDLVSTLLVGSGLFAIVYGLSDAANSAVSDAAAGQRVTLASAFGATSTWGWLVAGVVLVAGFALRQRLIEHPMLPMRVLADRARGGSMLSILLTAAAMFGVFIFLSFYLQTVARYTPVGAGDAFLPMVVALSAAAATTSTFVLPRIGPRPLIPLGMALGAIGMWIFTGLTVHSSYTGRILPGLLVTGAGMGMVFASALNTATARVDAEIAGVTSAAVNVVQQVGGAIGTALLSTVSIAALLARLTSPASPTSAAYKVAEVHGWSVAFWWSCILFAVGAVVAAIVLPWGRPQLGAHAAVPVA